MSKQYPSNCLPLELDTRIQDRARARRTDFLFNAACTLTAMLMAAVLVAKLSSPARSTVLPIAAVLVAKLSSPARSTVPPVRAAFEDMPVPLPCSPLVCPGLPQPPRD